MCKAIEEWKKDLIVEGYNKGEQVGYETALKNHVNALITSRNLSLKEALDILNVPEEDRKLFFTTH